MEKWILLENDSSSFFEKKNSKSKKFNLIEEGKKISQTMVNCVAFSLFIYKESFPVWKYQVC